MGKKEPTADPWYCDECKALRVRREEINKMTGGKSSRFPPKKYKIKVWMDRGNDDDPYDVYQEPQVLEAVAFHPDKKSKKSKKRSGKKRKLADVENEYGDDGMDVT